MSEPEGFLSRWSRRKQEAAQPSSAPTQSDRDADQASNPPAADEPARIPPAGSSETPFDLAKLPPIESITSATDIRAFLAPGVPVELTRAALRRAWTTDPAIRDFIGLAENQWDFTAPGGAPGFGPLPDTEQIRRLVESIVGERRPEAGDEGSLAPGTDPSKGEREASTAATTNIPAEQARLSPPIATTQQPRAAMVHRNKDDEPQADESNADASTHGRRRHGGALPR